MDDVLRKLWAKKSGVMSGSGSGDCDAAGTGSHFDDTPSIDGIESGLQSPHPSFRPSSPTASSDYQHVARSSSPRRSRSHSRSLSRTRRRVRALSPHPVQIHPQTGKETTKRSRNEKSQNSAHSISSSKHSTRRMNFIFRRKFFTQGLKKYRPSITLENTGNVARDHLASERTFLAYVRTSLALASTGVALVQLFTIAEVTSRSSNTPLNEMSRKVQRFARPLGVATVLLALVVLGLGEC